jgi:hypothetical protein
MVKWRNTGAHADGLAKRVGIHTARDIFGKFTHLQRADGARVLDDFKSAEHVALGIGQGLALFRAQGVRDPLAQRRVPPGLKGVLRCGHGAVDFRIGGKGDLRQHLLGRGIDDVVPFGSLRLYESTIDQQFDRLRRLALRGGNGHDR